MAEAARMIFLIREASLGYGWKRPCLPAFEKAIGKETAAGVFLPFVSFLKQVVGLWPVVVG
jgi:hypothetical protein